MFDSILRMIALTRKELLALLKDPRSRFSILIPPILQCLIYGYVATYDLNDVPYAVLDQDRSVASRDLLSRLDGTHVFQRIANLDRADDIANYINDQRALIVIQIGQDFERRLLTGQNADVQVIADGRNSNTAGIASGYVALIVNDFNADGRSQHAAMYGGNMAAAPVQVTTRAWFNPNLETRWHMIPSLIGTLTLLQTLVLTAMSVAREREQGTFDQLLVTPFRPGELMVGKALPAMFIGLVQSSMVLLVAQFWFHIPFAGSFINLYIGLSFFLMAAVGIGLLVSAVAATMQQAMLYSFVVVMPFVLLSGLTTPISSMPMVLQYFTMINPLRYAIDIVHLVYLEGAGLDRLIPALWPLGVMGVISLAAATWMFRTRIA
jgi:ABC-2 type transport system permease protein